jgi:pyruvate dehydrogenase E1 component alpha subunit
MSDLLPLYRCMVRIRAFEERVAELVEQKVVNTPCHLYIGQEAIAAGVCAALRPDDTIFGTHRSHGHYLAKGGDMNALMAEMFGKATGCSRGRGGSMHILATEVGVLGTVPIVSATIPLAVGAGLAHKMSRSNRVSVTFFGDGAMEEGTFHESMNLAAVYKLPVLFVCENNFYSSHLSLLERRAKDNLCQSAAAHGMENVQLDGNDVEAVLSAARTAVERARSGGGPAFLECRTYRWRGHVGASWDMDVGVKRRDELKDWLPKDPIARLRPRIADADRVQQLALQEVAAAEKFAAESPMPQPSELLMHVYREA